MKSNIKIPIFAVLLLSCLNLHSSLGQRGEFQLTLDEVDTNEVQLKAIKDNEYALKISQPNGQLLEQITVEGADSADPVIAKSGVVNVKYPNENLDLVLNYKADSSGYISSYRLSKETDEDMPVEFGIRLNIRDLKTLAG